MEQHAIPRQVTTFEFKLIGFMTLHQFLFLVISFPIAYIIWFLFPIPVVNWILSAATAFAGIAFAFFPFQDKPLDQWLVTLWKRLNSPTQYTYRKLEEPLYFLNDIMYLADPHIAVVHAQTQDHLNAYLASQGNKTQQKDVVRESTPTVQNGNFYYQSNLNTQVNTPKKQEIKLANLDQSGAPNTQNINFSNTIVTIPVQQAQQSETTSTTPSLPDQNTIQLAVQTQNAEKNLPVQDVKQTSTPAIKQVVQKPAFFTGVIRNSKQIPLAGVLVYVKDGSGKVVRLLKSNPHGIFATFNSLPAGQYDFETKDPSGMYLFDTIQVQITESNSYPIELISKENY